MNAQEFDQFIEKALADVRDTLVSKGAEYVPGTSEEMSRFHNFEVGAALNDQTIEQTLWGFVTKHIVSVSDMVKEEPLEYALARWDEKIGDIVVYMLLLHAMVTQAHRMHDAVTAKAVSAVSAEDNRKMYDMAIHTDPVNPNTSVQEMVANNLGMDVNNVLMHTDPRSTTIDKRPQTHFDTSIHEPDKTTIDFGPDNARAAQQHQEFMQRVTPPQ